MKILIIDNGTKHLGRLKKLLSKNKINIHPMLQKYTDSENYDLIILSGGSQMSIKNAPEIFNEEINLIETSAKPIIGICEGCEIIAYALNSELEYYNTETKGIKTIKFTNNIFTNFPNEIKVYETHHWAITKLGKDLAGIAKSNQGWEIIKHKEKPIYGFQFHPEMLVDKTLGDEIFSAAFGKIAFNRH